MESANGGESTTQIMKELWLTGCRRQCASRFCFISCAFKRKIPIYCVGITGLLNDTRFRSELFLKSLPRLAE